jgi:hypothetical protein
MVIMGRTFFTRRNFALAFSAAFAASAASSHALTIVRVFGGGTPASNVAGGGNLTAIFNAAADCWEHHILTSHTVTINFSWGALGSGILGQHGLVSQGGAPNRETAGQIQFTNDATVPWFMDSTPSTAFEYGTYTETSANLGGGLMNVGRIFSAPTGAAVGRFDLVGVAMHEIGHALGLSSANTSFQAENGDLDIDVQAPRPFAGATIPTISGAHLNIATAMMFPSVGPGVRGIASHADIVANAEISEFNELDLSRCMVPEPASIAAIGFGIAALAFRRRKS